MGGIVSKIMGVKKPQKPAVDQAAIQAQKDKEAAAKSAETEAQKASSATLAASLNRSAGVRKLMSLQRTSKVAAEKLGETSP